MLGLILYLTILITAAGAGYMAARTYENRVIHLEDLILVLKILRSEMEYRNDPLPELMERIARRMTGKAGDFLNAVCSFLKGDDRYDFYDSWKEAVNKIYGESALAESDRSILSRAGIELGKTDMSNQLALFAHLFDRLEEQKKEADEERRKKSRICRTLGISLGVLAVIVLL